MPRGPRTEQAKAKTVGNSTVMQKAVNIQAREAVLGALAFSVNVKQSSDSILEKDTVLVKVSGFC